jgi:hypothetical protein
MIRIATLLTLALLAGCASAAQEASPPAAAPPAETATDGMHTVILGVGESATLADGSRLTYRQLVNDSRCAPDVQCIWAGDAEILLRWQPAKGGHASEAALHTSPLQGRQTAAGFGPYRVHLEALERGIAPKATLRVE